VDKNTSQLSTLKKAAAEFKKEYENAGIFGGRSAIAEKYFSKFDGIFNNLK